MSAHRRLHVLVLAPPTITTVADLALKAAGADLYELRCDLLGIDRPAHVAPWVEACPGPVLVTVRSAAHGGQFRGTPQDAVALLRAGAEAGAAWVDAEPDVAPLLRPLPDGVGLLQSVHADVPAPAEGIRKIARPVNTAADFAALRDRAGQPDVSLVPYGALGATRGAFATVARGTTFVFGCMAEAVTPGQPPLRALVDELRTGEVGPDADLYALVGDPPGWSPSPAIHNAVFRATGRNALYVPLPGVSLDDALAMDAIQGVSVTMPYKDEAFARATQRDEIAEATGVVNTLVRNGDGWRGFNTDAYALYARMDRAEPGDEVIVYGSGATARSAVWAARERGYGVRVVCRNPAAGEELAARMDCDFAGRTTRRRPSDRILINATPAGATAPLPPFLKKLSLRGLDVIDTPYRTLRDPTDLVARAWARRDRAKCVDGFGVLEEQALSQARHFGAPADARHVENVIHWAARPLPPLFLIGARGVGKSTIGAQVAHLLGRPLADLDAEVERITGRSAADWIQTDGWERFRAVESEALSRVSFRQGVVVATGGGIVEHEPNRAALARGFAVWLDASPETLIARRGAEGDARPRWPGCNDLADEVRTLHDRRRDRYARWSHVRLDAEQGIDRVAVKVCAAWCDVQPVYKS